jgi:aldose sugar dehydrogenase
MTVGNGAGVRSLLSVTSAVAVLALAACGTADGTAIGQVPAPAGSSEPADGASTASPGGTPPAAPGGPPSPAPSSTAPPLKVEEAAGGLQHGWDIGFLPDGKVLVTERPARITLLSSGRPGATATRVAADLADVQVRGEGGLMGMVVHPDFASTRRFTTCQTHQAGGTGDIRLVTWRLSDDGRAATRERDLLTGLPLASGGRHSGCRPTLAADGTLLVGTGDTANGRIPQDLGSLGGKVLRLVLGTGEPAPGNPFLSSANLRERYVWTYGHRNVQGVAVRPGSGQVLTAEHGPTFDDEVNVLRAGANYGWDPSRGGTVDGYDESVPMTDRQRFPDAVEAVWQSGSTTQAVCAATFLSGTQWGGLDGALVVTALKGAKLLVFTLDPAGAVTSVAIPAEFSEAYGRLRAARTGPDGALYVTTSNGDDDKLLRVTPA